MKIRAPFYDGDSILREGPAPAPEAPPSEAEPRAAILRAAQAPGSVARFRAWLGAHFNHRAPQRG